MDKKKVIFMLRKLIRDLYPQTPAINPCNQGPLKKYYLLFEDDPKRLNRLIRSFDEQGVPLNGTYIDVAESRLHYYPISIGQYALAVYHSWLNTGNNEKRAHFLLIADWFMQHAILDERLGAYWLTDVPKPEYDVWEPWKSGFSQSRAISVLCRAYLETGNRAYLELAEKALLPFCFDISEGGVSVDRHKGQTFYEEYVAKWPTRVIDGHLFCLMGLYDMVRTAEGEGKELAQRLFDEGVEGLLRQILSYDLGYWLRFNRCEKPGYPVDDPCTLGYLRLVVRQLQILSDISGRKEIIVYANRFARYDKTSNILRMYLEKYKSLKKLNRL